MIRFISEWFEYIYYRSSLTYRFFKDDGNFSPTMVVAMIKAISIIDLFALAQNQGFIESSSDFESAGAGIVFLAIFLLEYNRYKGRFEAMHEKWKDESRKRRVLKGFLVFLSFIVPWTPLIVQFMINN